ncbi:MAG: hypothetical protein JWQ27_2975 [Ferruginibacter sp.]|nr:hypothetical protein [Ferruginibacter sp.]
MQENWRYTAKSITKYDPAFRNDKGVYLRSEWTSYKDIGERFNQVLFTKDDYIKTEQHYIEAVKLFFEFHSCEYFGLENLEIYNAKALENIDEIKLHLHVNQINVFKIKDIPQIVQLILREVIWGELISRFDNEIAVRFGYDFYMYFNSDRDISSLLEKIKQIGLYID